MPRMGFAQKLLFRVSSCSWCDFVDVLFGIVSTRSRNHTKSHEATRTSADVRRSKCAVLTARPLCAKRGAAAMSLLAAICTAGELC